MFDVQYLLISVWIYWLFYRYWFVECSCWWCWFVRVWHLLIVIWFLAQIQESSNNCSMLIKDVVWFQKYSFSSVFRQWNSILKTNMWTWLFYNRFQNVLMATNCKDYWRRKRMIGMDNSKQYVYSVLDTLWCNYNIIIPTRNYRFTNLSSTSQSVIFCIHDTHDPTKNL